MSTGAGAALAAVFGAVVGSFMNVVAHRLPRGESLVTPASRCVGCGVAIKPWHNVPVFGWLWLRGRCAACGAAISPRYPIVEAVTAILCALVVLDRGTGRGVWLALALVLLLVPVTLIDLDFRIIPNVLMAIGAVLAVAIVLVTRSDSIVEHLIAAGSAGGFFLLAALAYPRGMGMGDVKLAFVLGLFLGKGVALALLVALVTGTAVGIVIIVRKGQQAGRKTAVPFGPFLALGGAVALFAGSDAVNWYTRHFLHSS